MYRFARPSWRKRLDDSSTRRPSFCVALVLGASVASSQQTAAAESQVDRLASWKAKWEAGRTRWHKTTVNSVLEKYADSRLLLKDNARVLVPLCGKSIDMTYIAAKDTVSQVVGVEGVRKALDEFCQENSHLQIQAETPARGAAFEALRGQKILLLRGDFFGLDASVAEGYFDAVWDRGSLVAIMPALRPEYVKIIGKVMAPGGVILLSTWVRPNKDLTTGPPFSIDEVQVKELFGSLEWVDSIECVETQSILWKEPWYKAIALYWRVGNAKEKVFIIRAKEHLW